MNALSTCVSLDSPQCMKTRHDSVHTSFSHHCQCVEAGLRLEFFWLLLFWNILSFIVACV